MLPTVNYDSTELSKMFNTAIFSLMFDSTHSNSSLLCFLHNSQLFQI